MKRDCRILFLISILLLSGNYCLSQESVPLKTNVDKRTLISELEQVIPGLMKEADIPGMSIAVIMDGKIIWYKGFGIKNARTAEPVNDNTIFPAASLTKPFFAYLVAKLAEDGELDVDTPLIDYVPQDYIEKRYIGHSMDMEGFKKAWFERITARMILSHSSGLPHFGHRTPLRFLFEPSKKFGYSPDGYKYLQSVVEYIKYEPLEEIMKKYVIEPLGMTKSSMIWQQRYETQAAVGHDMFSETTGKFLIRRKAHAAATLYTTAKDYAMFVIAIMNDEGLNKETINEMLTPQVAYTTYFERKLVDKVFWSLGFGLDKTGNGDAFWQWGDYRTFRNFIIAYKKQKIGVVYLTNSNNGLRIGHDIIKHTIGGESLGLAALGRDNYCDLPEEVFARTIKTNGVNKEAIELFQKIRKNHPDDYNENGINKIGYALLRTNRTKVAIDVFKFNVEMFPKSANVYKSLADAYLVDGNDEIAIRYYNKTLEVIPFDPRNDKEYLEKLRKNASESLKKFESKK